MVDLSFLESFTKGDLRKMKRYINMYLSSAPDAFKNMQQNIAEKDWEQLRINAHSLKPQSDYMGISSLKAILVHIEEDAKEGKSENLQALYSDALQLHVQSEKFLRDYIEAI